MAVVTDPVISTVKLSKVYRSGIGMRLVSALVDVTFDVGRGEIFGFLGPNGAGKTSLIKILIGLARPTAGNALVFGRQARDAQVKARVGFLPESPYFYEYLTATEFLRLSAGLAGVPGSEVAGRVNSLLKLVRMEASAGVQMRGFSRGMLQRIGIAQALVGDPELVILDEPMGGLDPVGRKEFRDIIVGLRDQGKTVFFSTHILADVEMICDRVGIIINGRMVNIGGLGDILSDDVQAYEVTVTGLTGKFRKVLERVGDSAIRSGDALLVTVPDDAGVDRVMAIVREAGARVQAIVPRKRTLEDHFMAHVGGKRGA
ncbi:ABC transporter ATP-binding protein [candidate division WOR-3 bacterium]|nr:ABC transporter ATP-binding protein [candidate division WOR-3 bacterium]